MWRRASRVSTRSADGSASSPLRFAFGHSSRAPVPRTGQAGAGEGNRTLVVSLEGFCSTIELHPPVRRFGSDADAVAGRQGATRRLTRGKRLHYLAIRMTNLIAIAASSTVRFWWRSSTYAARWRD